MLKLIKSYLDSRSLNKLIDKLSLSLTSLGYTLQYIDDETEKVMYFNSIGEDFEISFKDLTNEFVENLIFVLNDEILEKISSLGYEFVDYLDFKNNNLPLQFLCKDLKTELEVVLSSGQILGRAQKTL